MSQKFYVSLVDREPTLRTMITVDTHSAAPLDAAEAFGRQVWEQIKRPLWFYVFVAPEDDPYLGSMWIIAGSLRPDGPYLRTSGALNGRNDTLAMQERECAEVCAKECRDTSVKSPHAAACLIGVREREWDAKCVQHTTMKCSSDVIGYTKDHLPGCPFHVRVPVQVML